MSLRRFVRTPKGLLIIVLSTLIVLAAPAAGVGRVLPVVIASSAAAMLVDAPYLWMGEGAWVFPDGALVTGLIVAMVLSPFEPWYVAAVTSGIGILSKYFFRVRTANVFNPAAFGLVATFYVFHTGQSWWGALSDISPLALGALFAAGVFITDRINKVPGMLAFLGTYYALVTATAFVSDPGRVAELYRAPDLNAALFFAFFMLTDPPTSPAKHGDQLAFGAIAAIVSYGVFETIGSAYFLLAGLLVANAWEARRRVRARARKATRRAAPGDLAGVPVSSATAQR